MYAVYKIQTGEILRIVSAPLSALSAQVNKGESAVLCPDDVHDDTHYVKHETGAIIEKIDYTLDYLPLPCTITIEGVTYEVTEQPTFEFDLAGTYIVEVDAGAKYLKKEFTIDYQTPISG